MPNSEPNGPVDDAWYTNISDSTFHGEISEAPVLTIVEFGASYMGACQMQAPVLEAIADQFRTHIRILKLDVYKNPISPRKWGVQSIPALLIFRHGTLVDHVTGMVSKQVLSDKLQTLLTSR